MLNRVSKNKNWPTIDESNRIWRRCQGLIPNGTQTLAKGPTQFSNGVAPKYLQRGRGARVWDVDGNEYLDYSMGLGPIILGYCNREVDKAITAQLELGITFSLMHPLEVELAELMRECIPNVESVRFSKTGCDVTSAAIRLARAFTGRDKILCCGYHGWHDWYIGVTDLNAGIPTAISELTSRFDYNNMESVIGSLDSNTACVILEPLMFEREQNGFISELRRVCDNNGTLLVFDEMWTGFRCALGGAQKFLGVRSDLSLFSKAMANGMPISAIAGRKDVMAVLERDVFFFTTFGGEALSLAAAVACINTIRQHSVLAYIADLGRILVEGINKITDDLSMEYVRVVGYPFRSQVEFDSKVGNPLEMKTLVQQELIRRGILWAGINTLCYAHTRADIDYTLESYAEALEDLKTAVGKGDIKARLKGETLKAVFRKTAK